MVTDSMAGHYIWLTRGDSKVRASHAARDAKMFSWNKPPQGGHPGQEYNCRCRAIPVTAEHQLPIPAQNPDNPLRYRDLVESGLITKFNTMTEDRNRFLDADDAAAIHEQRKQEGTRFKPGTTGMVLARRVNARDDAAKSSADFAAAVRDKGLGQIRTVKDEDSQEKNKLVAGKTAIDRLIDFIETMAKTGADMSTILSFQLVAPDAFKALDQAIKAVLERYEDYGKLTGEWGDKNPWYHNIQNMKAAKSFFGV